MTRHDVNSAEKFVEWAKGRRVEMQRHNSQLYRTEGGKLVGIPALKIYYSFYAKPDGVRAVWTYSETCEVDEDGWIVFKDDSPYKALTAIGQEPVLVRTR